jgi:hypothetical protein
MLMTGPLERGAMPMAVLIVALVLLSGGLAGCASSVPEPPSRPVGAGLDGLQRVVVVPSGETRFSVVQPSKEPPPELDEVLKWLPYKYILVPLARAAYWGVSWLMTRDRDSSGAPSDITPGVVVADAFARGLKASGPFDDVVPLGREPVGEARRNVDAIVRLTVPAWGLVSVREGDVPLVAAFADVRAQMVVRDNGVVVWEYEEDVTHPERLSADAVKQDRALSHQALTEVLERAGRRLANELVYARSRGR